MAFLQPSFARSVLTRLSASSKLVRRFLWRGVLRYQRFLTNFKYLLVRDAQTAARMGTILPTCAIEQSELHLLPLRRAPFCCDLISCSRRNQKREDSTETASE